MVQACSKRTYKYISTKCKKSIRLGSRRRGHRQREEAIRELHQQQLKDLVALSMITISLVSYQQWEKINILDYGPTQCDLMVEHSLIRFRTTSLICKSRLAAVYGLFKITVCSGYPEMTNGFQQIMGFKKLHSFLSFTEPLSGQCWKTVVIESYLVGYLFS